jgi:phospholipase D1/2
MSAVAAYAKTEDRPSLFVPGRNCMRVAHADRVSLIVDGDGYFKAFTHGALRAERSITIVGWDFHSRTRLYHGIPRVPDRLGDFLNFLVKRRRRLEVRILTWDYPVIFSKGRELSPIYGLGWRPKRRVRLRYDDHYPIGASQHQKIVVVDGALAFCGGLDLTLSRWDTSEHGATESRRINEGCEDAYAPFHDTVMAMDGDAARMLDEIVRDRWFRATGQPLKPVEPSTDPWPDSLPVSLTDTDVAAARTRAPVDGEAPIREVQQLHLDMIAAARRTLYIENQYFTSNALGEALAARLAEPDGPEVVAVLRLSTQGWLEAPTMGTLRTVLLRKLRDADRYGRFHAYYPHIPGLPEGQCCDLHSKLLIADDAYMRLGSANFSNRSMGLDTECDVALESRGDRRVARAIHDFRSVLLAEHLNCSPEDVERALGETGTVHGAIAALTTDERSLRKYERLDEPSDALLAVAGVADPENPVSLDTLIEQFSPEMTPRSVRPVWLMPVTVLLLAGVLAALWRFTPLARWANAEQIIEWASSFALVPGAPVLMVLAYTPASIVMFPRPLLTLLAVAAFGAWYGFVYAFIGIVLAAVATYALGVRLGRQGVRRIARGRLNRLSQLMRRRGLLAVVAVRLVPIAPFAVVNMMAGAIRIRPWHFVVGTAIGILPGTLVATIFGDQLFAGLRDPRAVDPMSIVAILALGGLLAAATWMVRRWLFADSPESHATRPRPID